MKLEYVGPKPIISYTGVSFDVAKEDKFVYIATALELYEALEPKNFTLTKVHNHTLHFKEIRPTELKRRLQKVCSNLDELLDKNNHNEEDLIEDSLEHAHKNTLLSPEEKEVLGKNITLMHDYLLQRSVNKAVYYCIIHQLAEMVQHEHLDYIITPMHPKIYHVLNTIHGALEQLKAPLDTNIEVFQKEKQLYIKMKVINEPA